MAEPREIVLTMGKPEARESGAPAVIHIAADPRIAAVGTAGSIESVGEAIALLREIADELESGACG